MGSLTSREFAWRITKPLRPGGVKSPCQPRLFLNPERTCLNDAEQILSIYVQSLNLQQAEHAVVVRTPEAGPTPGILPFGLWRYRTL